MDIVKEGLKYEDTIHFEIGQPDLKPSKKVKKAFTVKLTASNNEGSLQNLLDQDKDNRYTTESNMKPGMWLVIEFSAAYLVNTLILDAGKSAGDYPREYRIFVSEDGKNWGKSIKKGTNKFVPF